MATPKKTSSKKPTSKRVAAKSSVRKVGKKVSNKELKALKDSIFHTLDTDKTLPKKSTSAPAVSKKPFENIVLPEERLGRKSRYQAPWLFPAALLLVLFGAWVWLANFQVAPQRPAAIAIENALTALNKQDVSIFTRHVNVRALSTSVIDQLFETPQTDSATAPALSAKLEVLRQRFAQTVKPGLIDSLETQVLAYVQAGEFPADNAVSSNAILQRLWADMSDGEKVDVRVLTVSQEGDLAAATILIKREDLNVETVLNATLSKQDNAWKITGFPNLSAVLEDISAARITQFETRQQALLTKLSQTLVVDRLLKAPTENNSGLLLTLALKNNGEKDIVGFSGRVTFTDAGGRLMKTVIIKDNDVISAGRLMEKTWTVPVDTAISAERHLLVLPSNSIAAAFTPISLLFRDGTSLAVE